MSTPSYPVPGRGAWRLLGGLLPGTPGLTSPVGYYRLNTATEAPVGSTWLTRSDPTHHAQCVWFGVVAVQHLIGAVEDGWFGPDTCASLIKAQAIWAVTADGVAGPTTLKAALSGTIGEAATYAGVPLRILGGLLANESSLDPAAVGVNGGDHGLAQINLGVHSDTVSLAQAMNPDFSIQWTAQELSATHRAWAGKTIVDPWNIAIAHHNSPLLAQKWATTGIAPVVAARPFQIADYVQAVLHAW